MKKFAPKYFRRKDAPFAVEGSPDLSHSVEAVAITGFWSSEAADLLMMAECLDVKICTWDVGQPRERSSSECGAYSIHAQFGVHKSGWSEQTKRNKFLKTPYNPLLGLR